MWRFIWYIALIFVYGISFGTSAKSPCAVAVRDLRVYNWDLKLVVLQWNVTSTKDDCNKNLEYRVTLEGHEINKTLKTKWLNATWNEPACVLRSASVRPYRLGKPVGPASTIDLQDHITGDGADLLGVEVVYHTNEKGKNMVTVWWSMCDSICVDGVRVWYKGKTMEKYVELPLYPNWYTSENSVGDIEKIEVLPLHGGVAIGRQATSQNVTAHGINNPYSCLGKVPGDVRQLSKFSISQYADNPLTLLWDVCQSEEDPTLGNATQFKVETSPEFTLAPITYLRDEKKNNVLTGALVRMNVSDFCNMESIKIKVFRNNTDVGVWHTLDVASSLSNLRIRDFKVTRMTPRIITLRWERVVETMIFFLNCTAVYKVTLSPALAKTDNITKAVEKDELSFMTTSDKFTYRGDVSKLQSASVQLMQAGSPVGSPLIINLSDINTTVDRLRVGSDRKDSVRFEWPEHPVTGSDAVVEYKVQLLRQGQVTNEVVTSDLDLWVSNPCGLSGVTVQPIQNDRSLGEPNRLDLTSYFYEDVLSLNASRKGNDAIELTVTSSYGRHCAKYAYVVKTESRHHLQQILPGPGINHAIVDFNISACEVTDASLHSVHWAGMSSSFNLAGLRAGTIPKLKVSVELNHDEIFVSWKPSSNFTMCPQYVEVKINMTFLGHSHFEVAYGAESNRSIITKMVNCRDYVITVTTGDGKVHYSKTHSISKRDSGAEVAIQELEVASTSAILKLELDGEDEGDCLSSLKVVCFTPNLDQPTPWHFRRPKQSSSGLGSVTTRFKKGLTPDTLYQCSLLDTEVQHNLHFSFKTDATADGGAANSYPVTIEKLYPMHKQLGIFTGRKTN